MLFFSISGKSCRLSSFFKRMQCFLCLECMIYENLSISFCYKSSLISEHSMSSESQGAECLGLVQKPVYKRLRSGLRH